MHVVIIGGGIGGLTLAQGLLRQGIGVEVYERDLFAGSRWEGYRIDIEEMGMRALHACLPRAQWREFVETASPDDRLTFTTTDGKLLLKLDGDLLWPKTGELGGRFGVDRPTLRRVLQTGLDNVIRFNAEFVRYEHERDGRVTAIFADGHRATGDILIGADGSNSRVGAQYLPGGGLIDTGVTCIGTRHPLNAETRRWLPESMAHGVSMILGHPAFSFNAVFDPPKTLDVEPYILQAVSWNVDVAGGIDPEGKSDEEVRRIAEQMTRNWHPALRRLVNDSTTRAVLRLRYSKQRAPWKPSQVVLLGDALHSMPPTAGRGGNTALRDAHRLAREIGAIAAGKDLQEAIGGYEVDVRDYGAATIKESLDNIARFTGTGISGAINQAFLRSCSALPPLKRRMFGGPLGVGAIRPWEEERLPNWSQAA